MRRLSGVLLAGALLMLPAFSRTARPPRRHRRSSRWMARSRCGAWAIRPDRTADFEQIMTRVKEALMKSEAPEARQQLAGWRVMRGDTAMPDGNVIYTHIINPVPGADYNILQVLYTTITDPAEQQALYELYRGAFAANLGVSSGAVRVDLSQ